MYAAQKRAGEERERHAGRVQIRGAEVREQQDPGGGEHHPQDVERAPRPGHRHAQRPHELEGHRHAERDPVDRLVEGEVHARERQSEHRCQEEVSPAVLGDARAPRHGQQHGPDRHAEEHGPARSGLVEERLGQSAAPNWTERAAQSTRSGAGTDATVATGIIERWPPATSSWRTPSAEIDAPFALVDLDAMWSNAAEMLARAGGRPIRVASKSVRCRPLLSAILERDPGFRGLMTFTLRREPLAPRARLPRPAAGLPHRRPRGAGPAGAARARGRADRDGRLHRAARPDRRGRRAPGAGPSASASSSTWPGGPPAGG